MVWRNRYFSYFPITLERLRVIKSLNTHWKAFLTGNSLSDLLTDPNNITMLCIWKGRTLNRRLNQLYSIMHPPLSSHHWSDHLLQKGLIQCLPAKQQVCIKCHGRATYSTYRFVYCRFSRALWYTILSGWEERIESCDFIVFSLLTRLVTAHSRVFVRP